MENSWMGKSIGRFEFDNMVACLVAMDAAAKEDTETAMQATILK